ncbi:MAG: Imm32 family immunity protein [Candidatus Thiodiazotropha sp. L084R]
MSESWGGNELTSKAQSDDAKLIHHVKIYCHKGDEFQC